MKLRIEIADDMPDEVVIRCRKITDEVRRLQDAFESASAASELKLLIGEAEYFVPVDEVLFFETDDGKLAAHTADKMFYSEDTLSGIGSTVPSCFMRVSKSCVVNTARISSISKGITGSGEAHFSGTRKFVYVSRMYYKALQSKIYETRLSK